MHAGVHAHQPVAAVPVDLGGDAVAGLEAVPAILGDVQMDAGAPVLARIGDADGFAIGQSKDAGIARLAAAGGVEDRAVELDAGLAHAHHLGFAAFGVGVVAEDLFAHV